LYRVWHYICSLRLRVTRDLLLQLGTTPLSSYAENSGNPRAILVVASHD
jgi:hypothetical protein